MLQLENAPFIIGVTGHIKVRQDEEGDTKERLDLLFRFLLWRKSEKQPENPWLSPLVDLLNTAGQSVRNDQEIAAYQRALQGWPGLEKTPLMLLTSLAPGADSWAAEVALNLRDKEKLDIHVVAPLPMHHGTYRNASTFEDDADQVDAEKVKKYDELLNRVGKENTFAVRLAADEDSTEAAFKDRCVEDCQKNKTVERRARYLAAGEFIAEYAHLLIAVWDHDKDPEPCFDPYRLKPDITPVSAEGTAAIVQARRGHLKSNVLPGNDGLNLPHGGPLFHLYTHKATNTDPRNTIVPHARFLHCHSADVPDGSRDENLRRARVQLKQLALFNRIARNLYEFNKLPPSEASTHKEVEKLFKIKKDKQVILDLSQTLKQECCPLWQSFFQFLSLRARASDANAKLKDGQDWVLFWLFWLALAAASLGHLFVEWHTQKPVTIADNDHQTEPGHSDSGAPDSHAEEGVKAKPAATDASPAATPAPKTAPPPTDNPALEKAGNPASPADDKVDKVKSTPDTKPKKEEGHAEPHDPRRARFGTWAWLIAVFAVLFFAWKRSAHSIERGHDYRAIAEGMRVQAAWNLAGVGKSVPANYMQRQRGELDWIRGLIRAASLPYESWRDQMDGLSKQTQANAFRCVLNNWVLEQEKYFKDKAKVKLFELHSWHKLGAVLALAGVGGTILTATSAAFGSHEPLLWMRLNWWIGVILIAVCLGLVYADAQDRRKRQKKDTLMPHPHRPNLNMDFLPILTSFGKRIPTFIKNAVFILLDDWIVTSHAHSGEHVPRLTELWRMVRNGITYVPAAAALVFSAATIGTLIAVVWPTSPNVTIWTSIILGIYLIGGAMCIAWSEKQFDSEFAYQYGTMAPLFFAARLRLEPLVKKLEDIAASGNVEDFEKTKKETRDSLYELGLEALDENAEWLILHRARPLEPVMAG